VARPIGVGPSHHFTSSSLSIGQRPHGGYCAHWAMASRL